MCLPYEISGYISAPTIKKAGPKIQRPKLASRSIWQVKQRWANIVDSTSIRFFVSKFVKNFYIWIFLYEKHVVIFSKNLMKTWFFKLFRVTSNLVKKVVKNSVFIIFFEKITLSTCSWHQNTHICKIFYRIRT